VQILRWECNGAANQKWAIDWDPTSGSFAIISPVSQKCWNNYETALGGRLNQYTCDLGSDVNMEFYFEFQGFVENCAGAAKDMVRSSLYDILTPRAARVWLLAG
jgi:hypothetical protein